MSAVNVPGVKQPHMFVARQDVIDKMNAGRRARSERIAREKQDRERAEVRAENAKRRAHANDPRVKLCRAERARRDKQDTAAMRQAKREFDALMAAEFGTKNPRARQQAHRRSA